MRYSPTFFPDSPQVCVEMDVNRSKEKGQLVMEGTQLQATRQASEQELKSSGSQAFETSCTKAASSVVVNQEFRSS